MQYKTPSYMRPEGPAEGDVWVQKDLGNAYRFDGKRWVLLPRKKEAKHRKYKEKVFVFTRKMLRNIIRRRYNNKQLATVWEQYQAEHGSKRKTFTEIRK